MFVSAKTIKLGVPEGEAYGLYHDILWMKDFNINDIIFKLDSKIVVNRFNNP